MFHALPNFDLATINNKESVDFSLENQFFQCKMIQTFLFLNFDEIYMLTKQSKIDKIIIKCSINIACKQNEEFFSVRTKFLQQE